MNTVTNVTPTNTELSLSEIVDAQYKIFNEGMLPLIANNARVITTEIANPETGDNVRLVRVGKDIFGEFLKGIDELVRDQYNCRTCKQFFNGYGSLALLTKELEIIPLAWVTDETQWGPLTGEHFKQAYLNVLACFDTNSVEVLTSGLLGTMGDIFGQASRGGWMHLANTDIITTRAFLEGSAKDTNALGYGFNPETIAQLHATFRHYHEVLVENPVTLPLELMRKRDLAELELATRMVTDYYAVPEEKRTLWVLRYLMDIGLGIVHFKSSIVGNLIADMVENPSEAINNYYAYIDPTKYKRKVALPKEKEFEESVAFLESNGWSDKLVQRYATLADTVDYFKWSPKVTTEDAFSKLRSKVKNTEEAKALVYPIANISLTFFNKKLEELIESGELISVAYAPQYMNVGVLTCNVNPDAGDAYVDGNTIHQLFLSEAISFGSREFLIDTKQVDGLFPTYSADGDYVWVAAFGNSTVNIVIHQLNYVEELVPELRPHQRTIDAWDKTNPLNGVDSSGRSVAAQDVVTIIPLGVNSNAVVSLITDKVIYEYRITSAQ